MLTEFNYGNQPLELYPLDDDPVRAAKQLCDGDLLSQSYSGALLLLDVWDARTITVNDIVYTAPNISGVWGTWIREAKSNYSWIAEYTFATVTEYYYRNEGCSEKHPALLLARQFPDPPPALPIADRSEFVQTLPVQYNRKDPVIAYRLFYLMERSMAASWTRREKPYWMNF